MLPDSRIAGFSGNFSFARPRWLFSFGMGFVSNIRRNMLLYSVLQSLGGASYVARITLARKVCGTHGQNHRSYVGRKDFDQLKAALTVQSLLLY